MIAKKRYLYWFNYFIRKYRIIFILIISVALITTICSLISPLLLKSIFDYAYYYKDIPVFIKLLLAALIINLFTSLGFHLRIYFISYLEDNVLQNIYKLFYIKTQNVHINFFDKYTPGDLIYRISDDAKQSSELIVGALPHLINIICSFLIIIIFIKNINIALMIISLISIPVYCMQKYFETAKRAEVKELSVQKSSEVYDSLQESFNKMRWIKYLNKPLYEAKSMFKYLKEMLYVDRRQQNVGLVFGYISENLNHIWDIVFMFIAGLFVINSQITIGGLIAVTMLAAKIKEPLEEAIILLQEAAVDSISFRRVIEILDSPEEKYNIQKGAVVKKGEAIGAKLINLSFRYADSNKIVLNNLNMDIDENKITALVGGSGIGKTTILNLLYGFYKPNEGNILINAKNMEGYNLRNLRGSYGFVSQDSVFFHDTILNNLRYGNPKIDINEVIAVCRQLDIHQAIDSMPRGYNTLIQHASTNLSGGQRQKLSLVRALLKKPSFLILDEVTSQLDIESEEFIQEVILKLKGNLTILIISHHLASLRWADKIYVLGEGGSIVEEGSFYELLTKKGYFYKFYFMQSQHLQSFILNFQRELLLAKEYGYSFTFISLRYMNISENRDYSEFSDKIIQGLKDFIRETDFLTKTSKSEIWVLLVQTENSIIDKINNYIREFSQENNLPIEMRYSHNSPNDNSIEDLLRRTGIKIT